MIRSSARARCAGRCSATWKARSASNCCEGEFKRGDLVEIFVNDNGEIDFRLAERAPEAMQKVKKNAEEHAE